jgi:multisubunit Na+/H+ antiporter MnhG subunit
MSVQVFFLVNAAGWLFIAGVLLTMAVDVYERIHNAIDLSFFMLAILALLAVFMGISNLDLVKDGVEIVQTITK